MAVKAITFDLWDTIVHDDSDEPKREAQGLRSKAAERRHLLWQALDRHGPIDKAAVDLAFDVQEAAFRKVWFQQSITWEVADRLDVLLQGLGRTLPADDLAALVRQYEEMELAVSPDLINGAADVLADLSTRYKLGVISDAIYSPGRCLRELMARLSIKPYFQSFVFSDEAGRAKPDTATFEAAAAELGVDLSEMIHIGDRDSKDVQGPQAVGMKAILFTGSRDADTETTTADAICRSYADLPAAIARLAI